MKHASNAFAAITAISLPFAIDLPVQAQDGAAGLEEVIVTAQRREQSLQNVPISMQVVTGEALARQGFSDLGEMSNFVPGLNISPDVQNQTIMIRGVGTQGSNFGFEQAVATFIDGVHYGRASQVKNAFLDVERVEVLRGPQPVFFGQNATAGAISITSRKPGPTWEGNAVAEVGNNNLRTFEGAVGGPISDTFGVRFAGRYESSDGFLKDFVTGDRFPSWQSRVGRAILQWAPTQRFETTLKFEASNIDSGGRALAVGLSGRGEPDLTRGEGHMVGGIDSATIIPLQPGIGELGLREGPLFLPTPPEVTRAAGGAPNPVLDMTRYAVGADFAGSGKGFAARQDIKPLASYLQFDYELENGIEISSQTSYNYLDRSYVQHFGSGGPFLTNPITRSEDLDQWSSELRFTSPADGAFDWMAGIYWQDNKLRTTSSSWRADISNNQLRNARGFEDARWLSVFATASWHFLDDRLSLDLGGRYTDVTKDGRAEFSRARWIVEGGELATEAGQVIIGHTDFVPERELLGEYSSSRLDPQVVLSWRPRDDLSTFVKWAQAFKAGGFDTAVTNLPPQEDFIFADEIAETVEVGVKTRMLRGRGALNVAVFSSQFDDLQRSSFDEVLERNRTANVASQYIRGAEFDGSLVVSDELTLNFSGAWYDGEMKNFPGANCTEAEDIQGLCTGPGGTIDRSGERPTRLPEYQFIIGGDYERPIADRLVATFFANLLVTDGWIIDDNWDRTMIMKSHSDLNVAVGIGDMDGVWELSIWGRNLFEPRPTYNPDADIFPDGLVTLEAQSTMYRTVGAQLTYNFN